MGTQLPLPAGWARNYHGFRDARDRLDELVQDRLDAKAEIRAVLDRLTEKYDVPTADVTAAMGWVDDGLGDLLYLTDRAVDGSLAGSASLYPVGAQAQSCEVEMTYVYSALFSSQCARTRVTHGSNQSHMPGYGPTAPNPSYLLALRDCQSLV